MSALRPLPRWADVILLPVINLVLAFVVSGLVVFAIGQNPLAALQALIGGAFGSGYNFGYTLYYSTNFIFTGLAVAVAAHAGLFNIGGNGQAYVAGLGVITVALAMQAMPWWLTFPVAIIAGAAVGGLWGFIPGWLQAKRGSHVVITTIMFNFIASALMVYMVVNVLKPAGQMSPESAMIAPEGRMPKLGTFIPWLKNTDVNFTLLFGLLCLVGVYILIWHTRFGYAMRALGHNPTASRYAGMSNSRIIMIVMTLSGALAGMVAVNQVVGVQYRLVLDYVADAGFVGIAVALMGRNHPVGILFAALLFGALYQGGNELQYVIPGLSKEMVVVIQALVILFTGAMEGMFRPGLQRLFSSLAPKPEAAAPRPVKSEG
jgi:simple sugar transport system permease protein